MGVDERKQILKYDRSRTSDETGIKEGGREGWLITRMNFQAAEDDGESIASDEIPMSARRK